MCENLAVTVSFSQCRLLVGSKSVYRLRVKSEENGKKRNHHPYTLRLHKQTEYTVEVALSVPSGDDIAIRAVHFDNIPVRMCKAEPGAPVVPGGVFRGVFSFPASQLATDNKKRPLLKCTVETASFGTAEFAIQYKLYTGLVDCVFSAKSPALLSVIAHLEPATADTWRVIEGATPIYQVMQS